MAESEVLKVCVICNSVQKDAWSKVSVQSLCKIKEFSSQWNDVGRHVELFERMKTVVFSNDTPLYYHRKCYSSFCHKGNLQKAEKKKDNELIAISKKKCRSNEEESCDSHRKSRKLFDEKLCVFCQICDEEETFGVCSNIMGRKFLDIKLHSKNDSVRARLSFLQENEDAFARNIRYHRNCLRRETRHLESVNQPEQEETFYTVEKAVCNLELLNIVKNGITTKINTSKPGMDMNTIHNTYKSLLSQRNIPFNEERNFKPYLKDLMLTTIPGIDFVKHGSKPEEVFSSATIGEIVGNRKKDTCSEMEVIMAAAEIVRKEIHDKMNWKFNGTFSDFEDPKKLQQLIEWIIVGVTDGLGDERDVEVEKTTRNIVQYIIASFKTKRQANYKPMERGNVRKKQTPLTVGTGLMLYQKSRSKGDLDTFHNLNLSISYACCQRITTQIARTVISSSENETNGLLLPSFVKIGVRPIFAADNIDLGGDKCSFHGSDLMISQKCSSGKPFIRSKLVLIENTDYSRSLSQRIPVKYETCKKALSSGVQYTLQPTFGNFHHRIESSQKSTFSWLLMMFSCVEERLTATVDDLNHSINGNNTDEADQTMIPEDVTEINTENIPTWASFHSRISEPIQKSNVGIVAPLYDRSPTELPVLQTILSHAQKINSQIIGEGKRPIITLDGDLFGRAVKIENYKDVAIFRLGSLHIIMASLKCLGKYIEGSGIDLAWEVTGLYGPSVINQILEGRHVYRGIEAHLTTLTAVFTLFVREVTSPEDRKNITNEMNELRSTYSRKDDADCVKSKFLDTQARLEESSILKKIYCSLSKGTGVHKFLLNYMKQVINLLTFISATRNGNWKLHLDSLEEMCVYFHAHDQLNYAKWAPLYIADMRELETMDPEAFNFLNDGNFVISNSDVPFTAIDPDHAIEQQHKKMKARRGGFVGITGNPKALDKYFIVAPVLSSIVEEFKEYTGLEKTQRSSLHHESFIKGERNVRNAAKLCQALTKEGNPFSKQDLHNLISFSVPSEPVANDILNQYENGKLAFDKFVNDRLINQVVGFWEPQKRKRHLYFKECGVAVKTKVKGELVSIKEERNLIARLLVVARSHPELVPKDIIGEYEFHVCPPSNFNSEGSMHMVSNKHILVSQISSIELPENMTPLLTHLSNTMRKSLIIDAMCIVYSLQSKKDITCNQLAELFIKRISVLAHDYDEVRVLFDNYIEGSMKNRTREKRAGKYDVVHYHVTDSTEIPNLKKFLLHVKTKAELTVYLSEKLLDCYKSSNKDVLITFDSKFVSNKPLHNIVCMPEMQLGHHNLEEADQQILLHAVDIAQQNQQTVLDVYSLDTDVFVFLIGSYPLLPSTTTLIRGTDKIDIQENYCRLGKNRAEALIGWYSFKGSDNTGSFATKGLISHFKTFMDSDCNILQAFSLFGIGTEIPQEINRQMERYVCQLYRPHKCDIESIPELRWHLFAKFGKEGRQLPPTVGTLIPHIRRAYHHSLLIKTSTRPLPVVPHPTQFSWIEKNGAFVPQYCTLPPAPDAILSLRKCACSTGCKTRVCSCKRIGEMSCTDLCDCGDACENTIQKSEATDDLEELC